ncbi:hypothetical protein PY479_15885 [Shewanella sp. A32]|uniref:hypothetical protein n=1 Tax=Shewanella sp. A32 TaxID=3031327 RepID=UPI0023B99E54|nr:hypothetical protein [Shewanella sp. A32]MDF0535752.1 hypothetical protein [Shewanella sp. A32]
MTSAGKQRGNVFAFLLPLFVAGTVCALIFRAYADVIPAGGPVPYVFVSLFIFPIAAIWPLVKDLTELQEISYITPPERRRLSNLVKDIQKYLIASAVLLLIFACITATALYLVVIKSVETKAAMSGIGFFFGCEIYIFIFLFTMRLKVQNYKATLAARIEELKQSKKLLARFKDKK